MIRVRIKCVNKVRNSKGNIIKYQLIAEDNSRIEATAEQIKQEMRYNNRYDFINLQIDSAGRLVDKKIIVKNRDEKERERNSLNGKEFYDYLKLINDEYINPHGVRAFINDYKGKGNRLNDIVGIDYQPNKNFCRMTEGTRSRFSVLITLIQRQARENMIIVHQYNKETFDAEFPKQVEEILESWGFNPYAYANIVKALFYLAAEDKGLALVKFGDTREYHDGFDTFTYFEGDMILTSNYDKVKEFITQRGGEDSLTELSTRYTIEGNKLGEEFLERIKAEQ